MSSNKIKEIEYGVPRYAQTWETFSTEIIDIVHKYLVDKKLTLSDYVENVLEKNGIVHSEFTISILCRIKWGYYDE
jgi:hypothetical protein